MLCKPEEWSGKFHPALLSSHLQSHGNGLLPLGSHTQPQPPGGGTANQDASREEEVEELKMKDMKWDSHLKRISEFIQVLRS